MSVAETIRPEAVGGISEQFITPETIRNEQILVQRLTAIAIRNQVSKKTTPTDYAQSLASNFQALFSLGDDFLDQGPLTAVQSASLMATWSSNIVNPPQKLSRAYPHQTREDTSMLSSRRIVQFGLTNVVAESIGMDLQGLTASLDAKTEQRGHDLKADILEYYFRTVQGEQATFEIIEKIKRGEQTTNYLTDICIDGNAYAFILAHRIHQSYQIDSKKIWRPTEDDIEKTKGVSKYWQAADDAVDAINDTLEGKPKMLFLLSDMATMATRILAGEDRNLVINQSAWYRFLQNASPERKITFSELFCDETESDETKILEERISEFNEVKAVLAKSYDGLLESNQLEILAGIIKKINFLRPIRSAALSYSLYDVFPVGELGVHVKKIYLNKLRKLFPDIAI